MAYTLTIGGSTVSPAQPGSAGAPLRMRIDNNNDGQLSFTLFTTGTGTISAPASVGQEVILNDGSSNVFGGFVVRTERREITDRPTSTATIATVVHCRDYSALTERRLINAVYTSELAEDIVDDIVTSYLTGEGVTQTNVTSTGITITKAVYSYRSVSDALDELAEAIGYQWYIDADKDLHFYARGDKTAGTALTNSSRGFISMTVVDDVGQYRNSVTVRGGEGVTNSRTETLTGDGTRRVFNVSFPLAAKPSALTAATISIAAGDIGVRGLDTGKKWYWSKGSTELEQDETETVLGSSDDLEVTYTGLFPIIVLAEDEAEIAARLAAENTSGRYEMLDVDRSIETLDLAGDRASGLLRRYGAVPQTIRFETATSYTPGSLVQITLPEYDIDDEFLVDAVGARELHNGTLRYTVECLSGETMGGWRRWWKRLATRNKRLKVGDEFIIKLLKRSEAVTVGETNTVTSGYLAPWHTLDVTMYGWSSLFRELPADAGAAIYDVDQYSDGSQWT